jgi:hypothetical protein
LTAEKALCSQKMAGCDMPDRSLIPMKKIPEFREHSPFISRLGAEFLIKSK